MARRSIETLTEAVERLARELARGAGPVEQPDRYDVVVAVGGVGETVVETLAALPGVAAALPRGSTPAVDVLLHAAARYVVLAQWIEETGWARADRWASPLAEAPWGGGGVG